MFTNNGQSQVIMQRDDSARGARSLSLRARGRGTCVGRRRRHSGTRASQRLLATATADDVAQRDARESVQEFGCPMFRTDRQNYNSFILHYICCVAARSRLNFYDYIIGLSFFNEGFCQIV